MLFHTAGIEVAPWIPPLVAFVISFFTSMGGGIRCFPPAAVSNVVSRVYKPFGQRHQSIV